MSSTTAAKAFLFRTIPFYQILESVKNGSKAKLPDKLKQQLVKSVEKLLTLEVANPSDLESKAVEACKKSKLPANYASAIGKLIANGSNNLEYPSNIDQAKLKERNDYLHKQYLKIRKYPKATNENQQNTFTNLKCNISSRLAFKDDSLPTPAQRQMLINAFRQALRLDVGYNYKSKTHSMLSDLIKNPDGNTSASKVNLLTYALLEIGLEKGVFKTPDAWNINPPIELNLCEVEIIDSYNIGDEYDETTAKAEQAVDNLLSNNLLEPKGRTINTKEKTIEIKVNSKEIAKVLEKKLKLRQAQKLSQYNSNKRFPHSGNVSYHNKVKAKLLESLGLPAGIQIANPAQRMKIVSVFNTFFPGMNNMLQSSAHSKPFMEDGRLRSNTVNHLQAAIFEIAIEWGIVKNIDRSETLEIIPPIRLTFTKDANTYEYSFDQSENSADEILTEEKRLFQAIRKQLGTQKFALSNFMSNNGRRSIILDNPLSGIINPETRNIFNHIEAAIINELKLPAEADKITSKELRESIIKNFDEVYHDAENSTLLDKHFPLRGSMTNKMALAILFEQGLKFGVFEAYTDDGLYNGKTYPNLRDEFDPEKHKQADNVIKLDIKASSKPKSAREAFDNLLGQQRGPDKKKATMDDLFRQPATPIAAATETPAKAEAPKPPAKAKAPAKPPVKAKTPTKPVETPKTSDKAKTLVETAEAKATRERLAAEAAAIKHREDLSNGLLDFLNAYSEIINKNFAQGETK